MAIVRSLDPVVKNDLACYLKCFRKTTRHMRRVCWGLQTRYCNINGRENRIKTEKYKEQRKTFKE